MKGAAGGCPLNNWTPLPIVPKCIPCCDPLPPLEGDVLNGCSLKLKFFVGTGKYFVK